MSGDWASLASSIGSVGRESNLVRIGGASGTRCTRTVGSGRGCLGLVRVTGALIGGGDRAWTPLSTDKDTIDWSPIRNADTFAAVFIGTHVIPLRPAARFRIRTDCCAWSGMAATAGGIGSNFTVYAITG